ncbi:Uncharacterised protein [Mycobacteroides abscessus subsp. abscessus]|nr:Uncharacterised protein [Mycobacteroides abscessus subsp. abscessus]
MITPHYQDESVSLHHGDCLDVLRADDYGYEWNLGYRSARMFRPSLWHRVHGQGLGPAGRVRV